MRRRNNESYPYDIHIVDKLLWMIGDSKRAYEPNYRVRLRKVWADQNYESP